MKIGSTTFVPIIIFGFDLAVDEHGEQEVGNVRISCTVLTEPRNQSYTHHKVDHWKQQKQGKINSFRALRNKKYFDSVNHSVVNRALSQIETKCEKEEEGICEQKRERDR